MKDKKYLFGLVFIVLLFLLLFKVVNICKNHISSLLYLYNGFEIDGDTIIKYNGSGNVVIPSMIEGNIITKIGDYAFSSQNIDSVILPETITEIGDYAFSNNNITNLKIPENVKKIGEGAFIHNKIREIKISPNVNIGSACFNDNQLEDNQAFFYNVLSNGDIDYSEIVSYGGKIRSSVDIPEKQDNVNLLTIGEKCFYENNIIAVTIPESVENIKEEAFKGNYLVELYLSNNIKNIEVNAFSGNNYLGQIIIDNSKNNLINYPWGADKSNLYWLKK